MIKEGREAGEGSNGGGRGREGRGVMEGGEGRGGE